MKVTPEQSAVCQSFLQWTPVPALYNRRIDLQNHWGDSPHSVYSSIPHSFGTFAIQDPKELPRRYHKIWGQKDHQHSEALWRAHLVIAFLHPLYLVGIIGFYCPSAESRQDKKTMKIFIQVVWCKVLPCGRVCGNKAWRRFIWLFACVLTCSSAG